MITKTHEGLVGKDGNMVSSHLVLINLFKILGKEDKKTQKHEQPAGAS